MNPRRERPESLQQDCGLRLDLSCDCGRTGSFPVREEKGQSTVLLTDPHLSRVFFLNAVPRAATELPVRRS